MAARQGVKLKDHTVLALDIGSRFIKVAEMRLAKGQVSLLNVAVRPTPAGVLDNNQILDAVGLGRAIKELLVANKIKTRKVVVAVSGQSSVVVRPIDLPKMSRKELVDTMRFEVERHIPFTADEVVMDYAPLIEPELLPETESNMKVLLAVAQEELVKAYLKVLNVAGLQPLALDVQILSVIRSLVDIYQQDGSYEQTTALVNIGAVTTDISIISKGNVIFIRSVPIAGNALTEAIADQMGRSLDEAEELKKEHGRVFLEPAAGETVLSIGEEPPAESPESPDTQAPPFFSAFGSASGADESPAMFGGGAPAKPLFSLEEDFETSGPLNLGGSNTGLSFGTAEPTSSAGEDAASSFSFGSAFEMDDDVDDELPILRLNIDEEEEQEKPIPTFRLSEEVDDDLQVPPPVQPERAPSAMSGPVFDLSSELENQLPPQRSRPAFEAEPEETVFYTPPTPTPASTPITPEVPADEPFFTFGGSQEPPSGGPSLILPEEPVGIPETGPTLSFPGEDEPIPPSADAPAAGDDNTLFDLPQLIGDDASLQANAQSSEPRDEAFERRIFEAMLPTLVELATEIRRSLEYYSSREPDLPVEYAIMYGGTSRLPYLVEFLQHEVGMEFRQADPLQALDLSQLRQQHEYLRDLAPALPVCIGLGLRDMLE